jgi:uncharacterized protein YecE (DUF72 family)
MATARVGISGWVYPAWRTTFYPKGLAHARELAYAADRLTSIEINGTFYSLQRPSSFERWRDATPDEFVFAVKGPRFITHMKKLADPDRFLANFFASGVLALGAKLGPVLWQLPPTLGYHEQRLVTFFEALPRTTAAAAAVAAQHDERLEGRALTTVSVDQPLRHAMEVRHSTFLEPRFLEVLRAHDVAVVVADSAGRYPSLDAITTDFVYVRLHGADELYVSGYPPESLDDWAARVRRWTDQGLDVYAYFDNDAKVRAPYDAMGLIKRLGNHPAT